MSKEQIINRPLYMDHIISLLNRGMMLFLVGQRRVGKSYLLLLLKAWIEKEKAEANVFYIDKERIGDSDINSADELYERVAQKLPLGAENYLLIDEVQDVPSYENALRRLYAEERCQIVATGSNAEIFSSQLGTRLSGRYIEVPVYSLTYLEFLEFHNLEDNDSSLQKYLSVGGLPGLSLFNIDDNRHIRDYLFGVFNTIMMKDVIERHKVRNVPFMSNLCRFIADNIGKIISVKNIVNYLKSKEGKDAASDVTTSTYLNQLASALLLSPIYRFEIHGKQLLEQNYKYYFSDHGLRNLLCDFNVRGSIEKIMENVVWLHLVAHGFVVRVGQLRAGEIDFVASKGSQRMYVQVTYIMRSEETEQREFGNLWMIKDNYPKYLISMEPITGEHNDYPGIIHLHLRDFLKLRF
ncbi:MAG: ATP-binding protein [Muribaculaceae bacterium]|nr:ATP-binding protein [Muribaculaceae bacterium]